jgi:hypothetical protein
MSWISVKKQKPSDGPVLIWSLFYANGNAAVAFYAAGKWYLFHSDTSYEPIQEPDYWMPLPAPPKMEGGEG